MCWLGFKHLITCKFCPTCKTCGLSWSNNNHTELCGLSPKCSCGFDWLSGFHKDNCKYCPNLLLMLAYEKKDRITGKCPLCKVNK